MLIGKMVGECALNKIYMLPFCPHMDRAKRRYGQLYSDHIGRRNRSPVSEELDVLCAMNQPSFDKYVKTVKKGGTVLTTRLWSMPKGKRSGPRGVRDRRRQLGPQHRLTKGFQHHNVGGILGNIKGD